MTDAQLTALSTIAWIVGTIAAFILLAHWSAGGSWGISSAIARGLIGWAGRNSTIAGEWPASELPPLESPELDRLWGSDPISDTAAKEPAAPVAEIEELPSRHF